MASDSKKLLELLGCETSIARDTTHRKGIDWIMTGNREDANTIGHDHMFALTHDAKPSFLQSANSIEMIDAWYLWHG